MDLGVGVKKEFSSAMEDSSSSSWWSMIGGDHEDQVNDQNNKKCCADCRTTRTPLWRGGPSGPKSLCNACGIRYRKKMVSVMRLSKGNETIRGERTQTHHIDNDHNDTLSTETTKTSENLKVKLNLMALGKKQRCRRKRKLAEEEEAAVLLMALSCGSVFA